jgi:hypothetical protein
MWYWPSSQSLYRYVFKHTNHKVRPNNIKKFNSYPVFKGARGGVVVKALRYKPAGREFNSLCCHWNFSVTKSCWSHYGPGVDSATNRNEYQVYFLGGEGGWCVRLTTLPPSCTVVMKSGNLNFLEPSGPLQACNGTALTYPVFKLPRYHFVQTRYRCFI